MFSNCLQKFDEMPYKTLLWVAAGLVLVCQLAAIGFVADEQVTKAKIRDFQRQTEMQAIAQCIENAAGPARQNCIQQAHVVAGSSLPPAAGDGSGESKTQVLAGASSSNESGGSAGMVANVGTSARAGSMMTGQPAQGFMSASFVR